MKTPKKNFIIDVLAFISFVFLTSTGVIIYYVLPAGIGRSSTIWQLDRHQWGDIHFYFALSFLIILSLHVIQHWKWIKSLVKGRPRSTASGNRVALGLVGLFALLAIAIAPIISPVEKAEHSKNEMEHTSGKDKAVLKIDGSMTLDDVARISSVPKDYIIRKLDLPPNVSTEQKLGQLKNEYNFKMEDVRKVVEEYNATD